MSPLLLPRYLVGSRDAILELASNRWTPVVGVLLCLSAGLARSYDGEDLVHESWHLVRPLAAAVVGATLLFVLLLLVAPDPSASHRERAGTARASPLAFAGLYFCTAPLAWLYGIPVERLLDPLAAAEANLWLLALVSAWRVLLITRVASVLWGMHPLGAFAAVMLFADAAVLVVLLFFDAPVIDVMGGLRLEEREQLVNGVKISVIALGLLTLLVWFGGALGYGLHGSPEPAFPLRPPSAAPRRVLALSAAAILLFALPLPWTQPEQVARGRVDRLLAAGDTAAAVALMSERAARDFPPGWSPPRSPSLGGRGSPPPLLSPADRAVLEQGAAAWVAEVYARRAEERLREALAWHPWRSRWSDLWPDRENNAGEVAVVDASHAEAAAYVLAHAAHLDDETRTSLQRVLTEAAAVPRTVDENGPEP